MTKKYWEILGLWAIAPFLYVGVNWISHLIEHPHEQYVLEFHPEIILPAIAITAYVSYLVVKRED